MPEGRDVLEWLFRDIGCDYLSDLRAGTYRVKAIRRAATAADLTLSELQEVARYLTGAADFATPEEARAYLLGEIGGKGRSGPV